ncbi:MAG: hypothetical protein K6E95_02770 [Lachnospiraceae bacterium]|nr:hypothetical protein [Lachnospiraceae bacterium]
MTALEIILLVLGIAFIILSFFIIDKSTPHIKATGISRADTEGLAKMGEDIKQNINGEAGRIIADTQDRLESLSNDKIIAVGEYSDQVIEKIEADHKQVVFLYQMLCDKEEELKEMTNRMSTLKTECERVLMEEKEGSDKKESFREEMDKLREQLEEEKERVREELENEKARAREELEKEREMLKAQSEKEADAAAETEKADEESADIFVQEDAVAEQEKEDAVDEPVRKPAPVKNSKTSKTAKETTSKQSSKSSASSKKTENARKGGWESIKATDGRDTRMLSRNDEIIALYKQNKSVMEISRLLQMGQGEVKLIIDLYCR